MRNVVWFSCGAASAVLAKLAVNEGLNPVVVYCNTITQERIIISHPPGCEHRAVAEIQKPRII